MEFSPNEKYIVSYSAEEPRGPRERASLTLNIFDTFTGEPAKHRLLLSGVSQHLPLIQWLHEAPACVRLQRPASQCAVLMSQLRLPAFCFPGALL